MAKRKARTFKHPTSVDQEDTSRQSPVLLLVFSDEPLQYSQLSLSRSERFLLWLYDFRNKLLRVRDRLRKLVGLGGSPSGTAERQFEEGNVEGEIRLRNRYSEWVERERSQDSKGRHNSVLTVVKQLAETTLLNWQVETWGERDFRAEDQESRLRKLKPTAVIADIWFQKDSGLNFRHEARDFLLRARAAGASQTYLVSTLPEDPPDRSAFPVAGEMCTKNHRLSFNAFIPLFHYVTNPWDELSNLVKYIDSVWLFSDSLDCNNDQFDEVSLPSERKAESRSTSGGSVIVVRPDSQTRGISLSGETPVDRPLVIEDLDDDGRVHRIDIVDCVFTQPVMIRRCKSIRSLRLQRCVFEAGLTIDRCEFLEDVVIEHNLFCTSLPWLYACDFNGRFTFRCNAVGPRESEQESPGKAKEGTLSIPHLMFHRCNFMDRVYVGFGEKRAKATWYTCHFVQGRYTEIVFPFLSPCDLSVAAASHKQDSDYFRFREKFQNDLTDDITFDRHDVDLRFTNCTLAGRIVIREHPWPVGRYDRKYGIGLNLSGSTLAGALNLQQIRLRWLNLDRASILGGEIFMTRHALASQRRPPAKFAPLELAAERCGLIFEERLSFGLERPRFSTHMVRRHRLVEYNDDLNREQLQHLTISQQYEDLRNAFSRSPNTDWEEDYCHFKATHFRQLAERAEHEKEMLNRYRDRLDAKSTERTEHPPRLSDSQRGFAKETTWNCMLAVIWVYIASFILGMIPGVGQEKGFSGSIRGPLNLPLSFVLIWASVSFFVIYSTSQRARFKLKWWFSRLLLRFVAVGIYPARTVVTGAMLVVAFAFLYFASCVFKNETVGWVETSTNEPLVGQHLDGIGRCLYFSAVTFTTLGYGDYYPTGFMRLVAGAEAFIGAILIAVITVSIVRQFLRR